MDNLKAQPIVIGFSHYNTLGLLRSLGEAGYRPTLVLIRERDSDLSSFVAKSKYIGTCYFTSEDKLIETLKNIKVDNSKCMLFPSGDSVAEILDKSYDDLSSIFIVPNIAGIQNSLRNANHKENMRLCAEEFGFNSPKTWVIKSISENMVDDIVFPVIIKAIHSQDASKNIQIFNSKEELLPVVDALLKQSDEVQIQTFIDKEKEVIYLGWACNDDVCIPCLMEKIREYPPKFGGTGFGYFSPDVNKYFDIEHLTEVIRSYRYTGLFSVEYIIYAGIPYFLEINFRNDGNGYFPGFGGVNLPVQLMLRCNGKAVCPDNRISGSFYMMREYNDYKWRKQNGYPLYNWLKDISKVSVFQYWNPSDIFPFIFFMKEHVANLLSNKIKRALRQLHLLR